jgi:hypothetical protein
MQLFSSHQRTKHWMTNEQINWLIVPKRLPANISIFSFLVSTRIKFLKTLYRTDSGLRETGQRLLITTCSPFCQLESLGSSVSRGQGTFTNTDQVLEAQESEMLSIWWEIRYKWTINQWNEQECNAVLEKSALALFKPPKN